MRYQEISGLFQWGSTGFLEYQEGSEGSGGSKGLQRVQGVSSGSKGSQKCFKGISGAFQGASFKIQIYHLVFDLMGFYKVPCVSGLLQGISGAFQEFSEAIRRSPRNSNKGIPGGFRECQGH